MDSFWKNKRVLITGANGFLGSHLSIVLLRNGARVIGIIKETPKVSYLKIALKQIRRPKIRIVKSDVTNFKAMLDIFKKYRPHVCLHVAAQPIVVIANKSPFPTFEANIKGTWNILEAARISKVRSVVVASSDKAYGTHKKLPYNEEAALLALHPYDASKSCADIISRCYAHTYGLPVAVTRCANIYGPGDFNFSRIIPATIEAAILKRSPIIRSDGTPLRDYVFIDDIVRGYLVLAKKLYRGKVKSGEAFNFGTGRPISVLSLVNKILKISQRQDLKPVILSKKKIKGEIDKQYLSSRKAKVILGWSACKPFMKGLEESFTWYCRNL